MFIPNEKSRRVQIEFAEYLGIVIPSVVAVMVEKGLVRHALDAELQKIMTSMIPDIMKEINEAMIQRGICKPGEFLAKD